MNNSRSPLSADKQEAPIRTMAPSFEPTNANIYLTLQPPPIKKKKKRTAFIFHDGASHVRRRVSNAHQNVQCTYLSFMSSTSDHARTESAMTTYMHIRKWKTRMNISMPKFFRRHEIDTSHLCPHYITLHDITSHYNYKRCSRGWWPLANVCYLDTCRCSCFRNFRYL